MSGLATPERDLIEHNIKHVCVNSISVNHIKT